MTSRCINEINKLLKPGETGSIWLTNDELAPECDWLLITDRKYNKNMRFYKSDTIVDTYNGIKLKNCPIDTFLGSSVFSEYNMTVIRKQPYVKYIDDKKITTELQKLQIPVYLVVSKLQDPYVPLYYPSGPYNLLVSIFDRLNKHYPDNPFV
jgi:hypothetical protein